MLPVQPPGEPPLIDLDWTTAIQAVQLGVMYLILRPWLFAPYLRMRDERRRRTDGERARAREFDARSRIIEADLDARRDRARRHAVEEMAARIGEADASASRAIDAVRREREQALDEARAAIARETERARPRLLGELADLARAISRRILGREPS